MYDLTFGQNGHFSRKNQPKEPCVFGPLPLIKMNILLVNVNILIKLNLLKNHDFL
jgi:hypothetical protein